MLDECLELHVEQLSPGLCVKNIVVVRSLNISLKIKKSVQPCTSKRQIKIYLYLSGLNIEFKYLTLKMKIL